MAHQCDVLIAKITMKIRDEANDSRLNFQHRLTIRNARAAAKRVPLRPALISVQFLECLSRPLSKIHFEERVGKLHLHTKLFCNWLRRLATAFQRTAEK